MLALAAVIVVAGAWAYAPGLSGVLVLDDVRAIARNPTIRTVWPLATPLSPPSQTTVAGRPLANLSFAINYAIAPVDARDTFDPAPPAGDRATTDRFLRNIRGYHLLNLCIHLAAALALFGVVRRTLLTERLRPRFLHAAPWMAAIVALVWVVHPLTTAAVTYVVQRVESLMGLFYLLTLYGAIRAVDPDETRPRAWVAAAIASSACGMATKEVMVTAPLMVALWIYLLGASTSRRQAARLAAGLAATWVVLAVLVYGERRAPSIALQPAMVWQYLITQSAVLVHYVRLAFAPSPLAALYDWPLAASLREVAPQAAPVGAALVLTLAALARRHPAAFIGAWFFVTLAPSSSVLPIVTEVAAEHRMYLALAGLVTGVVVILAAVADRVVPGVLALAPDAHAPASRRGRALAPMAVALTTLAVVAWLGSATRARNAVYASDVALWGDTVAARPGDARPRVAYGSALAAAGRAAEAEAQLQSAVSLAPDDPVARVRLGALLARHDRVDAAIPHLERALAVSPGDADAHRFLGDIYAARRQDALAVTHYEQALAAIPGDPALAARLAALLADSRDPVVRHPARALTLAEQAVTRTARRDARMLEILAVSQAASGRLGEAAATAREALAIARARGEAAFASALEYRAAAYDQAARQSFGPRR